MFEVLILNNYFSSKESISEIYFLIAFIIIKYRKRSY